MRATRNWGMIRSGETFEALATTIVFFEDSRAKLFGRRGNDGGQDARSGDGKTVYQAKHHTKESATDAIRDAKNEARDKVAKCRQPGNPRYEQWASVTDWVLVTNARFNPKDDQRWKTEVEPLFADLGVIATYWEGQTLDGYLTKHPAIDRAFFQNENRVFLSPPEACRVVADKDYFTRRNELAPYVGRKSELATFDEFLASDKRFLQVRAAGGVGKTRFILEAACEVAGRGEWQVFWANVATMEASSTWFEGIAPERPTLLVVDEPKDERLIELLHEQLGSRIGRAQKWKIAIAVRSSNDPVLRALQHPQVKPRVDELLLQPLDRQECEQVCLELMESGNLASTTSQSWREETAKTLASRFTGYPVWLTLAVHLLEADGSLAKLPDTAKDLCEFYLGQALKSAPDKARDVLRWVALLGTVNREDTTQLDAISAETKLADSSDIQAILDRLVSSRLLRVWGGHDRLVDVKPDVLRDHVLREWLVRERSYGAERLVPTNAAAKLTTQLTDALVNGEADDREERILEALARTDFLLGYAGKQVRLAAPVFARLDGALSDMSAAKRVALVETLKEVGAYYAEEMLQLISRMRQEPAADETIEGHWKTRTFTQDDVLRELPDVCHRVARGMLTEDQAALVLEELYALVLEEQRMFPAGPPNDGKRAEGAIRNLLENGPFYHREFGDVAAQVVLRETSLDSLENLTASKLKALRAITKPLCDVERNHNWFEGASFRMNRQVLLAGHPNVQGRRAVLQRLRAVLEVHHDRLAVDAKAELWKIVAKAHTQANYAKGQLTDPSVQPGSLLSEWLVEDLQWAKSVLARRTPSPRELYCARRLWHWHVDHGEEECRALAKELESFYFDHPTVAMFEGLTDRGLNPEVTQHADSKAIELALSGVGSLQAFFTDACDFFGDDDASRMQIVSGALGRIADEHGSVRQFVASGLQHDRLGSPAHNFAMSAISAWVFTRRQRDPKTIPSLLVELLESGTPDKQLDIVNMLYGSGYGRADALLDSAEEWNLVRGLQSLFVETRAFRAYACCIVWGLRHDWHALKSDLDDLLAQTNAKQREDVMRGLIEELHRMLGRDDRVEPPSDLLRWLWDHLATVPNLNNLKHSKRWYLDQICDRLGKVPLPWVIDALRTRAAAQDGIERASFDSPVNLTFIVDTVNAQNFTDPVVDAAVSTMVGLLDESLLMRHWLPKLLARIDPDGLLAPRRLATSLESARTVKDIEKLSRAACHYRLGSSEWRQIARAAFIASKRLPVKDRERVYYAVSETGRWSWHGPAGQVPTPFTDAVDAAKRGQDEETESDFKPFWMWRVKSTELVMRAQEERLKEEVWD